MVSRRSRIKMQFGNDWKPQGNAGALAIRSEIPFVRPIEVNLNVWDTRTEPIQD